MLSVSFGGSCPDRLHRDESDCDVTLITSIQIIMMILSYKSPNDRISIQDTTNIIENFVHHAEVKAEKYI